MLNYSGGIMKVAVIMEGETITVDNVMWEKAYSIRQRDPPRPKKN